jgi:hypothetical protein
VLVSMLCVRLKLKAVKSNAQAAMTSEIIVAVSKPFTPFPRSLLLRDIADITHPLAIWTSAEL